MKRCRTPGCTNEAVPRQALCKRCRNESDRKRYATKRRERVLGPVQPSHAALKNWVPTADVLRNQIAVLGDELLKLEARAHEASPISRPALERLLSEKRERLDSLRKRLQNSEILCTS